MKSEFEFENILEVEESMQDAQIFINTLNGRRTAHPDSYMTVVDFDQLEKWTKERKFSSEQMTYCCEYWKSNVNCGPTWKIAATMIEGYGGLKEPVPTI
jgi:hypothetical protein